MNDWLANLFSRISLKGSPSRRLVSVTVGAVLLVWISSAAGWIGPVPEIPFTVLAMLIIVLGTVALSPSS